MSVALYAVRPDWMDWASVELPSGLGWIRWVGAGIALACPPLAEWVFSNLGRNVSETVLVKRDHELVTTGPYRWVRHPLYSTGLLLFGGIGLMNASWIVLLLVAITAVGVLAVVIPREEEALTARFGDEYRALVRRTGRLLPRPGGGPDPPA